MTKILNYPQFPMKNVQILNQNCLFGKRTFTQYGKQVTDFHYGIDLMGLDRGSEPIVSPADGKCIYLTHNDGTGCKTIVLAHGGLCDDGSVILTKHSHCSKFYVKVNDKVKRNQIVAQEGATGNASGNHDHTETWIIPADVWHNPKTGKYYTYKFADRAKYAVDPLTVYRLYPHQKAIGWNVNQFMLLQEDSKKYLEKVSNLLQNAIKIIHKIKGI